MSEKRRDNKGRILRTGESQRKDLTYMYRYTDIKGDRKTVYAGTLQALREKEDLIQKVVQRGLDYAAGKMTVHEMVERHIAQKRNLKENSKISYRSLARLIEKDQYGSMQIRDVNATITKEFVLRMYQDGRSFSSIRHTLAILKVAFQNAVIDDVIYRNPISFHLSDVIPKATERREGITAREKELLLQAMLEDKWGQKLYDDVVILLETGLRISELYGLTVSNVDFKHRRLTIDHQVIIPMERGTVTMQIGPPKSESGNRTIPLTDAAIFSLKRAIHNRCYQPKEIDGYCDFIFVGRNGYPRRASRLQDLLKHVVERFNASSETEKLPHITPHMLRHTFCSDCIAKGMDIKTVQYLMGHAKVNMLLDTYAHADYDVVERAVLHG